MDDPKEYNVGSRVIFKWGQHLEKKCFQEGKGLSSRYKKGEDNGRARSLGRRPG